MARIIAICNQKGGVGKTTTAVNLGAYLANHGKRVLVVDFDPQANASSALGIDTMRLEKSVYHGILGKERAEEIIYASPVHKLHIMPSTAHLAGALVELVDVPEREFLLRRFLHRLRHDYDYILIDLSPSLSLLAVNALAAADEVLIPVQAEYYSLEGLGQLLETIDLLKRNFSHSLKIAGALITMYDSRQRLSQEVARNLRKHFPHRVFQAVIPRNSSLAEAPSFSKPVVMYHPDSSGALAYRNLAQEIIKDEIMGYNSEYSPGKDFGNFNI